MLAGAGRTGSPLATRSGIGGTAEGAAGGGLPLSFPRAALPALAALTGSGAAPAAGCLHERRFNRQKGLRRPPAAARVRHIAAAMALAAVLTVANYGAGTGLLAAAVRVDPQKAFETSQSVIGRPVGDHVLTATGGESFSVKAYRGKPLVVSLVYSSCGSFCPITTQHLLAAVEAARRVIGGERFEVLTVGFDARNDTPARMALFAANQHIDYPNWRVASADGPAIEVLLQDLGFSYKEIAGGFDHIAQTTIVGSDGRVFRQVYGDNFPIQMFMEPLKDAVYGTKASWSIRSIIDRVNFICTTFDPSAGRYRIDYGLIFGGFLGALSLILMGGVIAREWLRAGRARGA